MAFLASYVCSNDPRDKNVAKPNKSPTHMASLDIICIFGTFNLKPKTNYINFWVFNLNF